MGLTGELGAYVSRLRLNDIPAPAAALAKAGFADCCAVMIAGAGEPPVALVDAELRGDDGGAQSATLVTGGGRRPVQHAALVNGMAAHILDYDDVALDGHPSAVLVPAILAQAEAGSANGAQMIEAYVAGFETWAELQAREPGHLHEVGLHPTAVFGAVGAAAACASLRRLDAAQSAAAMAMAASMSAGLVANFGTMTKSFQVGRAAQSGVIAARLVQAGMTASPDALEHDSGFLAALSPTRKPERAAPFDGSAGRRLQLAEQGLNIKRYPVCYGAHRSIDGVLALREAGGFDLADIEGVHVDIGEVQMVMLRNHLPQTALEAKFSLEFAVAAGLVFGNVGLAQLRDEIVLRDDIQALMRKVAYTTTSERAGLLPFAPADTVTLRLRGGRALQGEPVAAPKGSAENPLSRDELRAKFLDCAAARLEPEAAGDFFNRVMDLENLETAARLWQ